MAPTYPQYNNYYDPVGSQANQPQGYAYHNPGTSVSQPPSVTYSAQSYPNYGHNTYNTVQQGSNTSGQHHAGSSGVGTSSAVGGTGAITGTGQNNQASASRSGTTQQYDSGWGNPNYATSSYSGNLQIPGRSQSNTSPVYASSGSSANNFGRSTNATNQPAQSNIPTYGQKTGSQNYSSTGSADNSRMTYGASQRGIAAGEPSRYASPFHAVQAQQQQSRQQGHARQSSQTSTYQATPATNSRGSDQRQESATMAAAANTTVDPSQVYDFRAERERKAKIEAEKRRKQDEADAVKKAEEARVAEAKRLAEEQQANEAKRRMEEAKRQADEARAAAKAEADRRKDEQRKARESKNAATALASLASSSSAPHLNEAEPPANDEEAEMRAMFQKMREFNSKNPAMLAKLWEEERRAHAGQSQSPQPAQVTRPAASTPKPAVPSKASSSQASAANATASNSAKPAPAEKAKASKASPNMSVARSKAPEVTTNQGSTNLWPPGKKGLLADIAARWLHGVNPQKVVTAFEILQLLDQNPNYVQLCESLEGLGLKFERAAFARELLRGVPPASSANQHTSKGSDATIMSANGTLAQATGAAAVSGTEHTPSLQASSAPGQQQRRPSSLMGWNNQPNGKATSSNNGMVDYEMPSFHNSSAPNQTADGTSFSSQPGRAGPQSAIGNSHSRQPSQSVQPSRRSMSNVQQGAPVPVGSARQTPDVKPMSPPRPPANKEEAARKRGFGELVDLTAEESDEDAPPKKIMQTAQGFGPRPFQPQPPQSQPHLNQQRDSPFAFNTRGAPVVPTGPSPGSTAPPFNPPGVPGIPAVANMGRMSTGSPAMTPTANMRATDVSGPVSAKSPLPNSTMLPFKRKGPTNEQLQAERIRGKMVVEPIMRDRVARKSAYDSRTIARDVLLATGRHPDMRALNSHLNVMQKMLGDRGGMADGSGNKSDLATIKWDIIDPDPPKKKESSSLVQAQDVAEIQDADDEGDMSSLNHKHRAPGGAATARQSSAALDLSDKPATPDAMPKKRGRPPRSSMPGTHTFVSVNDKMSAAGQQGMGAAGTPRQGSGQPGTPATVPAARAPAASQAPTDGSVGYSAFRHFDENGNPIKKKGRPVGWRKNIHSREAQGLAPAKSASAGVKPKPAVPKQPEKLQEPNYQIYRCKWLGCAAELHSLDVLKKHMIKVHGRPDGEDLFECLWQDCDSKTKRVTGPGRTRLDNATFSDIGGWLSHVDKEHLQPVAWRLGDGPRGGLSDQAESEASEAYLSDSRGRSVTPIIQPMANFGFGQTMPARIGRPPAGASKDERGAQAELQKLKERKIAVGPTMEKMGVRLANEKRRMGFLDDENFEDIVESESE